jgi:hypothetical protein
MLAVVEREAVIRAEAGIHSSEVRAADQWVPAFRRDAGRGGVAPL